jgi:hypothetical protein
MGEMNEKRAEWALEAMEVDAFFQMLDPKEGGPDTAGIPTPTAFLHKNLHKKQSWRTPG